MKIAILRAATWAIRPSYVALLAYAVASCATSTGVMTLGPGMYRTSARASPARGGSSEAERLALQDAQKFCQDRGEQISVINLNTRSTSIYGAGAADATFRCLSAGQSQGNASEPVGDIIAQNLITGAVYWGTTTTIPGTTRAVVRMVPFGAVAAECRGQSAITSLMPGFTGSLGAVKLLCSDGRTVTGEFTYENPSRGYGVGQDDAGAKYRFIFGYGAADIAAAKALIEQRFEAAQKNANGGSGAVRTIGH